MPETNMPRDRKSGNQAETVRREPSSLESIAQIVDTLAPGQTPRMLSEIQLADRFCVLVGHVSEFIAKADRLLAFGILQGI